MTQGMFAIPLLVEVCIVVVTVTFVALVATTIVAGIRLGQAAARLTAAAQVAVVRLERIAREAEELLASMREVMTPAQRVAKRFEHLGERAADLSDAVLEEIAKPILAAVSVARGVRTGSAQLLDLLTHRSSRRSSNKGDLDHE